MNYWNNIKSRYILYAISGILLGLTAFSSVLAHRYDNYLTGRMDKLDKISSNRHKIKKQIEDTDSVVKRFRSDFNLDTDNFNADAYILNSLDKIKGQLKNAAVKVGEIRDYKGERAVSVDIKMSQRDYSMLVSTVQYMESFRIPHFKIDTFSIVKKDSRELLLSIRGTLLMPQL